MTDQYPIRRALISVSDKTGLKELVTALASHDVAFVSTGGTAGLIRSWGHQVTEVADLTGFPEMMDGRVKTLHPMVHGGLLALRDKADHVAAMDQHGIEAIDLLISNLYPFEETLARGADYDEVIENIDIGGPAMIRAAAKNHQFVTVMTDPRDYDALISELANGGQTGYAFRQKMAQAAYARTATYDAAVSGWMANAIGENFPRRRAFGGELRQLMRYGENPHQLAAFYTDGSSRPGVATAKQHQGKELSYNNINDTDAAFELVSEFDPADGPACVIVKHANPCGVARGATLAEAYAKAFDCDRTSAFGGIVALNQRLDRATAEAITQIFTEVVIAPGADADAIEVFASKKNLRLLTTDGLADPMTRALTFRQVAGGFLVQERDNGRVTESELKVVTQRQPLPDEIRDLLFASRVAKHVKSNAIVFAKGLRTVGVGAGQMSRVDSTRIAARKAADMAELLGLPDSLAKGAAVSSDAFFPFPDGIEALAEAGATAVIQPGGSLKDADVIAAADRLGLAMVFTGMRHFRH
ncbi:MAG: bifunctional phosphoribosylaminoimidazolecarboxamide formyltransferase/IMP cyclohydrolase [Deltaproteobacteria bacterium]